MERFIYIFVLCVVIFDISDCFIEDDIWTTPRVEYGARIKTTSGRRQARELDYTPAQQLDLFKLTGHAISRRSQSEIWNWDLWCQLQPLPGNCSKEIVRYYYDAQLDQCQTFTHTGCGGNKNNFDSTLTCERHCKGASYMRIREADIISSTCELQPSSGLCMAFIQKYYYDVKTSSCKEFTYGGCGGNQNRFNSLEDCETMCKKRRSLNDGDT